MFIPAYYREENKAKNIAFMKAYPFAMLISASVDYPAITHITCLLEEAGERLIIKGHMARGNENT